MMRGRGNLRDSDQRKMNIRLLTTGSSQRRGSRAYRLKCGVGYVSYGCLDQLSYATQILVGGSISYS